jgi:RHH-type proline utilization regulon transcriptional repressor/proline dehydrogenase/delta 1-pyrroline-5-carboxylate dehydrogenase
LFVHKNIKDHFIERLLAALETYNLEIGTDPSCDIGPLIDRTSYEKTIERMMAFEADADVKVLLRGGEVDKGDGYLVSPMVVEVSDIEHSVLQDEFFAPILALMFVDDFDDGIDKLNDCSYGLTAAVFSRHPEHLVRAQERCEVGNLYLNRNCTGAMVGRQPFGGLKWSGTGRKAGGPGYLQQFAEAKASTENSCRHGYVGE